MASSEKRCLYEVLGVQRDCSADEIRTAYKRQALQRHPDKLVQSGLSQGDATAQFQELVNAYEVLSDPRERSWYDSHRSQILFSDPSSAPDSSIPNLFSFFSNSVFSGYSDSARGFFRVYSDVFTKIYANELSFARKLGLDLHAVREAPLMGNLDSPYTQVTAFYNYWLAFATVLDFCWVDQYDAMAGVNRKSRRVMEDENKKLRKKAKREYNESVRGLAEFVKKRDKRVADMLVKKNLELEKKREEEKERKKRLERERMEKASSYQEPEWARIEEIDEEVDEEETKRNEFYCVVCGKKFKSEKQWKNHEQSKKHKEKVAELRESFADEDEYQEVEDDEDSEMVKSVDDYEVGNAKKLNERNVDSDGFESVEDEVEKIEKKFRDDIAIEEEEIEYEAESSDREVEEKHDVIYNINHNVKNVKGVSRSPGDDDDETSVLEAMMSGHKNRRRATSRHDHIASSTEPNAENDTEETDFMEYDSRKNTRKNKAAKKGRGKKNGVASQPEEMNVHDHLRMEESSSHSFAEKESTGEGDDLAEIQNNSFHSSAKDDNGIEDDNKSAKSLKESSQPVDKKGAMKIDLDRKGAAKKDLDKKGAVKIDATSRSKSSAKGKKAKASSKNSSNACGTCGEEFDSRNKLHQHLGETGHATLKSR